MTVSGRQQSSGRDRQPATGLPAPRVGYLLRMYPRFSQTFVVNEILELERQGLDVHILALRKPDDGEFHEAVCRVKARAEYVPETLGGLVRKLRSRCERRASPGALMRAVRCVLCHSGARWADLLQAMLVLRWARKRRIDHLHVHFGTHEATVALLAHLMGGLSYSLTLHAFDIFRDNVDRRLLARKINASRFTNTVSEFNRRYLVEQIAGVDPSKVRVNYNGVDLDQFHPNGAVRDENSIFSVGRLIEKKGFVHLVRAIARLRSAGLNVRCRIAGEGPESGPLKAEIARLGLASQVELVGPLKQSRVRAMLQQGTCFVLPCVPAHDGNIDALPTVLLESLACGCPSVSTRLSGVPEIIEDRVSGLLVAPGNDAALADALREILSNSALAAVLAAGGRRRAEQRFDIRDNVRRLHDWLLEAAQPAAYTAWTATQNSALKTHDAHGEPAATGVSTC
ncbi:MAG TPA: glycosyltransferase family 4 protein [Phycisphaerae bacterium]|jgi:glycosyltransferase involved in cell wall biosynthesis